jgi:PhnB protein
MSGLTGPGVASFPEEVVMGTVKPIPEGYSTVVAYISVKGASEAIAYYSQAFGAKELLRMPMPDGKVGHAEIKIGDSIVMLADEMDHPDAIAKSPSTLGGVTSGLALYVEDCDAMFNRAVAAGGKVRRPLTNQFYGDRSGTIEDPFGQVWTISTHVEDVPPEEMRRRMEAFTKG